jgi:hypothetical protein
MAHQRKPCAKWVALVKEFDLAQGHPQSRIDDQLPRNWADLDSSWRRRVVSSGQDQICDLREGLAQAR